MFLYFCQSLIFPFYLKYYQLGGIAENIDFLNTNKVEVAVLDVLDHIDFALFVDPTAGWLENYFGIQREASETVDDFVDRLTVNGASNIAAHELGHLSGLRKYLIHRCASLASLPGSHVNDGLN